MHYVYVENGVVSDQCQANPSNLFNAEYAAKFLEAEDAVTYGWTYSGGKFYPPPAPTPEDIQAQNKEKATQLLQETDWTAPESIANPGESNPYLTNRNDFLEYRSAVRQIAVNPPSTIVTNWPVKPSEVWSV